MDVTLTILLLLALATHSYFQYKEKIKLLTEIKKITAEINQKLNAIVIFTSNIEGVITTAAWQGRITPVRKNRETA
jgi:hypothetical protein